MTDTTDTLRQTAIDRAMRMLDAAGAEYAIEFNGQTFGVLKLAPKPKRKPVYPRGTTKAYYEPMLGHLQPGQSAIVPRGGFDLTILAKNISAYAVHTWGAGSMLTHKNEAADCIEVLRM